MIYGSKERFPSRKTFETSWVHSSWICPSITGVGVKNQAAVMAVVRVWSIGGELSIFLVIIHRFQTQTNPEILDMEHKSCTLEYYGNLNRVYDCVQVVSHGAYDDRKGSPNFPLA